MDLLVLDEVAAHPDSRRCWHDEGAVAGDEAGSDQRVRIATEAAIERTLRPRPAARQGTNIRTLRPAEVGVDARDVAEVGMAGPERVDHFLGLQSRPYLRDQDISVLDGFQVCACEAVVPAAAEPLA